MLIRFKKDLILLCIMGVVAVGAASITALCTGTDTEQPDLRITASFYPMYIIALNVADGVEGVQTSCMAANQTGCLHDYQISSNDMKMLEKSDVFLINGGGMESFFTDVAENYPHLTVINAGKGMEEKIISLEDEEHVQNEEDAHNHEENAHFWLNPEYYKLQIKNTAEGFAAADPAHAKQYHKNAEQYIAQVSKASEGYQSLSIPDQTGVVVFHDAFVYLADYLGLTVVHAVEIDGETPPGTGEMAHVADEVRENHVQILFTEAQFSTQFAQTICQETGAVSYVIDSLVTGDGKPDSYLKGMERNLAVLKEAFDGGK